MVELLEPGTEAETCLMAGRGMNGLKGVVVCFNPNNQRYTLELAKGDMMSLKIRNVRAIKRNQDCGEGPGANANKTDAEPSPSTTYAKDQEVFYLSAGGATPATIIATHHDSSLDPYYTIRLADGQEKQTEAKHLTPIREEERHYSVSGPPREGTVSSSLPRYPPAPSVEDEEDEGGTGRSGGQNLGISPVTVALAAAAAYFYLKSSSNNNPNAPPAHGNYYPHNMAEEVGVSVPVLIASAVFAFLAWEWGTKPGRRPRGDFQLSNLSLRLSRCDIWEATGLLALLLWALEFPVYHIVSLGVLSYFLWKFGTRNGARRFSWDNVKTRLGNLDVWEALMVAHVVQGGLGALNHMARHRRR